MQRHNLHSRIVALVIGVISIGIFSIVYLGYTQQEKQLLEEKRTASRFMAEPILNTIYEDMLEERADLARHLIEGLEDIEGVERVQIIRSNGVEEAFQDLKTIEAVKLEFGEIKPEWLADHANKAVNIAEGVETEGFKEAYAKFQKSDDAGPSYYIEKGEPALFTYLHPIEKKSKCNACHDGEGARGILMISTSLDDMYAALGYQRAKWIITGLLALFVGGVVLTLLIKKSITGPLEETVGVIKRITEGDADISERIKTSSEDEIGFLANAFNNMLESMQKRDDANRRLFATVIKSREEWVATFDAIQDYISIHDSNHRITKVNKALADRFNMRPEEMIGKNCFKLFHGTDDAPENCPHEKTLSTGLTATEEFGEAGGCPMTLDGFFEITTFPVKDDEGRTVSTVHVMRDVTEEKILKEQFFHTEKMSSIGKFVAGIAHELNNPLMGMALARYCSMQPTTRGLPTLT